MSIFWFITGACVSNLITYFILEYKKFKENIIPFRDIKKMMEANDIRFKHRIGFNSHFTYDKEKVMDVVYNTHSGNISIYNTNTQMPILVNSGTGKMNILNDEIVDLIKYKFYKELYQDISDIDGVLYSNNLLTKTEAPPNKNTTVDGNKINNTIEFVLEDKNNKDDVVEDSDSKINEIISKMKKHGFDYLSKQEKTYISDINNW